MRALLLVTLPSVLVMACMSMSDEGHGDPRREADSCVVGGCSGQLCTDDPNIGGTCEWRDAYACYAEATCGRQADGECGWVQTTELAHCLESPPSS